MMDTEDHMHEPAVKEGYAYDCYPVRWKAYKPGAQTNKKGRWQRMNEYGGWENCDKPAEVFQSPDLLEAQAALIAEAREVINALLAEYEDGYENASGFRRVFIEGGTREPEAFDRATAFLAKLDKVSPDPVPHDRRSPMEHERG